MRHRIRRDVVSYSRRDGRSTRRNRRAWDPDHARYLLQPERQLRRSSVADDWRLDPVTAFGRLAPLVVEVGSGTGEALIASAAARPDLDHLGIEVYRPGVARTVVQVARLGLTNVRMLEGDARQVLLTALPTGSVSEIRVFFPDPWPKLRHHKRRLLEAEVLGACCRVLRPGGVLRLATDSADYARQMRDLGAGCAGLTNPHRGERSDPDDPAGGYAPRFQGRALTRFEAKAAALGHPVYDLTFVRVAAAERGPGDVGRPTRR